MHAQCSHADDHSNQHLPNSRSPSSRCDSMPPALSSHSPYLPAGTQSRADPYPHLNKHPPQLSTEPPLKSQSTNTTPPPPPRSTRAPQIPQITPCRTERHRKHIHVHMYFHAHLPLPAPFNPCAIFATRTSRPDTSEPTCDISARAAGPSPSPCVHTRIQICRLVIRHMLDTASAPLGFGAGTQPHRQARHTCAHACM